MEDSMNTKLAVFGMAALGMAALHGAPAAAQERSSTQEIQVYAGEMFGLGDHMTETPISGRTPILDDNATFGARYTYNFTDTWGVQLSAGHSPGRASYVPSGNSDLGLTTVDVDAVWTFSRFYPIVGYTVAGMGYAWANLDRTIQGTVYGRPTSISDSNGYTANAGIGAKYYLTNNLFLDAEGRYRYLNRILNNYGQGMNTVETTLGVGWKF
jgi:opacity protein-like surface antigen